jgi:acyl-CoA thioester hydrolase
MRIDLPEQKKLVHEIIVPVRWGDMDALGHVNNTLYFRYMEIARVAWLREIGFRPDLQGEGVVVVNAFCNFLRQITYPADILVKTYISAPSRSSFDSWITMEQTTEPGVLYATGGATTVWVNFPTQKSAPLPDWLRQVVSG